MSRINEFSRWMWFLAFSLAVCFSGRQQAWGSSLPGSQPAERSFEAPEPPNLEPAADWPAMAGLAAIPTQPAQRMITPASLIREAEAHFQVGKKHYLEGDEEAARREFDRAIDILLSAPDDAQARPAVEKVLDQLVDAIHHYDVSGMGAGDPLADPGFQRSPLEEIPQMTFPIDPKIKNKVIEEVRATISQLPLQVNDAVLSYIHYFSSERGRKILIYGLRRAGRYRKMVQRILDEEGVPQELIYLAQAESGFMPRARSRRWATGMWQFVQGRGREYGLMQTVYTDDRLDPERATRSAARHLRDLYHRYGDWYLAMAAYNCGPGVIDRAVERTGYADFWELRRLGVLPKETANYVPIILAMIIMGKNANEYGIDDIDPDPALQYDTVEMTAPTGLLLISDLVESPVSEIRDLNPALLKNIAPAGYRLRIPRGTAASVVAGLQAVPENRRASWRVHRVGEGETLASIARRYGMMERSILAVNHDAAANAEAGDLLLIPAAQSSRTAVSTRASSRRAHSRKASRASAKPASARHRGSARVSGSSRGAHAAKTSPSSKAAGQRGRAPTRPRGSKAAAHGQRARGANRG